LKLFTICIGGTLAEIAETVNALYPELVGNIVHMQSRGQYSAILYQADEALPVRGSHGIKRYGGSEPYASRIKRHAGRALFEMLGVIAILIVGVLSAQLILHRAEHLGEASWDQEHMRALPERECPPDRRMYVDVDDGEREIVFFLECTHP
jgi:hypothetical protein